MDRTIHSHPAACGQYIAIYSHEADLARSGYDMASLYPVGPVRSGYNGVTRGFYSGPYFEHQSWANNVQRLQRILSHIRGLFWTSKRFLLASTCRPPLITQLPVYSCHLSECVYVWVYIIVIQYQLRRSNGIMSKKQNALMLRHKVALINEAESGKSCRQLADKFNIGRTQATSIIKRKAELLLEYDQNIYMQQWFFCNK